MIRKLKFKLIILTSSALLVLLAIILFSMNLINYASVVKDSDEILTLLSLNGGSFPDIIYPDKPSEEDAPSYISPELPYESRYFSVKLDSSGNITNIDISRIASVTYSEAVNYTVKALTVKKDSGFIDQFRFLRYLENDTLNVIFLDCGRTLDAVTSFFLTGVFIALSGYILVIIVLYFLSDRIIRPIAESYDKQKRFITDAGHEIKTPLTVINANAELLELDIGKNESIDDIRQQTERLRRLTDDLIYLSKMEENNQITMTEFPISDIVLESAESFSARIKSEGKSLELNITPMLSIKGNPRSLEQLLIILLDNALKYSPDGDIITVELTKQGRSVALSVTNHIERILHEEEMSKIFDRFYRTDPSRNSQTGGHGIGLSIAKAIVESHNGRLHAAVEPERVFRITASFIG